MSHVCRILFATLTVILTQNAVALPSGNRWFSVPVNYQVFSHSQIKGISSFSTNVLPRVQSAFATWNQQTCTSWRSSYAGQFSSPNNTSAVTSNDKQNRVIWLAGNQWRYGSATLGLTTTSYFSGSGEIFDADMELNNNITWSNSGASAPKAYDVETVVLHEVGHFLGLDHTPNSSNSVMYPTVMPGSVVRALETPDINDVCSVYPAITGGQGSPCGPGYAGCSSGLQCRGESGSASKICTRDCTSGQICPSGYTCQAADVGSACLVLSVPKDLCRFCTDGSQCATGNCVTNGRNNWCTTACTSSANCGAGYECLEGGAGKVCVPVSNCPSQCTNSNQCAVGYACVNGACEATGKTGDRCEISLYCGSCAECVGTTDEAYCRSCCGGQGGGGTCNNCAPSLCSGNFYCDGVNGQPDSVCVPPVGLAACETCSSSQPCSLGLQCIGGKCHSACQPLSPGNCAACYAVDAGVGYCACTGESRIAGESCAVGANGALSACVTGLKCVGGASPICRKPCDPSFAGSCTDLEQCQIVDGHHVCMPRLTPGTLCSPCDAGQCGEGLSCVGGRCYNPCQPSSPSCSTCVSVTENSGVCACEDQRVGIGKACGFAAPGDVSICHFGLACINSTCRATCDLNNPTNCETNESCLYAEGSLVCLPEGELPASPSVDGGRSNSRSVGCGCHTTTADSIAFVAFGFFLWASRLTRKRAHHK